MHKWIIRELSHTLGIPLCFWDYEFYTLDKPNNCLMLLKLPHHLLEFLRIESRMNKRLSFC